MTNTPPQITKPSEPVSPSELKIPTNEEDTSVISASFSQWSAPLPPPEHFNNYPEATQKWIMALTDKETENRHIMAKTALNAETDFRRRAQNISMIISLVVIIVSGVLVWQGYSYGLTLALLVLLPILSSFLENIKDMFGSGTKDTKDD